MSAPQTPSPDSFPCCQQAPGAEQVVPVRSLGLSYTPAHLHGTQCPFSSCPSFSLSPVASDRLQLIPVPHYRLLRPGKPGWESRQEVQASASNCAQGLHFLGQPLAMALGPGQWVTELSVAPCLFVLLCPSSPASLGPPLKDPALPGRWARDLVTSCPR